MTSLLQSEDHRFNSVGPLPLLKHSISILKIGGDPNVLMALSHDPSPRLARKLKLLEWTVTTAESCTGGMLTSALTDISGASIWFRQGWVTYSNEAKMKELGVAPENFKGDTVPGAVSFPVAFGMAQVPHNDLAQILESQLQESQALEEMSPSLLGLLLSAHIVDRPMHSCQSIKS